MSYFVKEIKKVVERVVHDCNIPVRAHFPINVVSSSTTFSPRKAVIEILITEPLVNETLCNIDHRMMEECHLKVWKFTGSYYPPSGTNTGSIIYRVTES